MSDYDPKSIPILDDVIENEIADDVISLEDKKNLESNDPESSYTKNNFDLFPEESITTENNNIEPQTENFENIKNESDRFDVEDTNFSALESENATSDYSDIENIIFEEPIHDDTVIKSIEVSESESALIEYQDDEKEYSTGENSTDDNPVEQQTFKLDWNASLEPIVADIVQQLLPDLEQQLRFLVQQALEDKLPDDIIKTLTKNFNKDQQQ